MSIIREESIKTISQSIGIENLHPHLPKAFAPDVELRLRELIQDACKFSSHSKRSTLTTSDINEALRSKRMECLYGFTMGNQGTKDSKNKFIRVEKGKSLFIYEDKEVDVSELLNTSMPNCPAETSFHLHWFAVEGIQPRIPENECSLDSESTNDERIMGSGQMVPKRLVKHVLSEEMQLYYVKVTEAIEQKDFSMHQAVYESLSKDPGLYQLLPYFSKYIYDQIQRHTSDLEMLTSIMRMTRCLLKNSYLQIELYLHQLLPAILTCVVGKTLCKDPFENHWALREYAARLVAQICHQFGDQYENLQPRVSRTYYEAFTNPKRSFPTHYGAILGIMYLGSFSMEVLLFPSLLPYLKQLEQILHASNPNPIQRMESQYCYGVLVHAAGRYLQKFFALASPSIPSTTKTVSTTKTSASLSATDASHSVSAKVNNSSLTSITKTQHSNTFVTMLQETFKEHLLPYPISFEVSKSSTPLPEKESTDISSPSSNNPIASNSKSYSSCFSYTSNVWIV